VDEDVSLDTNAIEEEINRLGSMNRGEILTSEIFITAVTL
jgi:hypothetical protein